MFKNYEQISHSHQNNKKENEELSHCFIIFGVFIATLMNILELKRIIPLLWIS